MQSRDLTPTRRVALLLAIGLLVPMLVAACGKAVGDTIADATITTRVKTALLNDPGVGVLRIDVNTTAGVVTLSGNVGSKDEADRAVQLARSVSGVKDVKSALKISGATTATLPRESASRGRRSAAATR